MLQDLQERGRIERIVVLGAKPRAILPLVDAHAVVTANNAVELGLAYRTRFGSRIIALVASGVLRTRDDVCSALKSAEPDELIILGNDLENPEQFVRDGLGLKKTKVTILTPQERNALMISRLGWRSVMLAVHIIWMRGVKNFVRYVIPDLMTKREMSFLNRTTGLNAILYAMQRFESTQEIIIAGMSPKAGCHWKGPGGLDEKDAKADRITIKYWTDTQKKHLYTTDTVMHEFTNIPMWEGEVFYHQTE